MSKKVISVVAMDLKRGIGNDLGMPWHLPNEYKHFVKVSKTTKDKSKQNAIVMGRSTWLSIPEKFRPLKGRLNVVLSRTLQQSDVPEGVLLENNLEAALKTLNSEKYNSIESIIIGGGEGVYRESITKNFCNVIYLTKIQQEFSCDVFFPEFDESIYKEVDDSEISNDVQEENDIKYTFHVYAKDGVVL